MSQLMYNYWNCDTCHLFDDCPSRAQIQAALAALAEGLPLADGPMVTVNVQCVRSGVTPQCTATAVNCPGCPAAFSCPTRKAVIPAVSALCTAINLPKDTAGNAIEPSPGGVTKLHINCQRA